MIITNNEDALRVKCEDVSPEEVGELISLLERELKNSARFGNPGIGLAAPQIGIAKNIAIVRMGKTKDLDIDLVNCKIINQYDPFLFTEEGCLSFPGRVENTIRYQEIHVANNLILPNSFIASGLLSVACQHELDHLNQKLFIDNIAPKPKPIVISNKVKPNEPCICGSNKKYKKCCGR